MSTRDDDRGVLLWLLGGALSTGGFAAAGLSEALGAEPVDPWEIAGWWAFLGVTSAVALGGALGLWRRYRWAARRGALISAADERAWAGRSPGEAEPSEEETLRARLSVELEADWLSLETAERFVARLEASGGGPETLALLPGLELALSGLAARVEAQVRRSLRPWPLDSLGGPCAIGGAVEIPSLAADQIAYLRGRIAALAVEQGGR